MTNKLHNENEGPSLDIRQRLQELGSSEGITWADLTSTLCHSFIY